MVAFVLRQLVRRLARACRFAAALSTSLGGVCFLVVLRGVLVGDDLNRPIVPAFILFGVFTFLLCGLCEWIVRRGGKPEPLPAGWWRLIAVDRLPGPARVFAAKRLLLNHRWSAVHPFVGDRLVAIGPRLEPWLTAELERALESSAGYSDWGNAEFLDHLCPGWRPRWGPLRAAAYCERFVIPSAGAVEAAKDAELRGPHKEVLLNMVDLIGPWLDTTTLERLAHLPDTAHFVEHRETYEYDAGAAYEEGRAQSWGMKTETRVRYERGGTVSFGLVRKRANVLLAGRRGRRTGASAAAAAPAAPRRRDRAKRA